MINVLQVVPVLGYGGVEKIVQNYYSVIDREEFHFDYVSHGDFVEYNQKLIDEGSEIFFLLTIGKLGVKGYEKEIEEKLDIKKYDIVHIHTGDITGLYAKAYKKAGAKKVICHAHTAHPVSKLAKIGRGYFKYLACKYSDARLGCGLLAGEYCFGKGNFTLLPNSIEYRKFTDVTEQEISLLREELQLPENKIIVGHVGSFCYPKNHEFLINVFYDLQRRRKDCILLLVGDGPDRDKCQNQIKKLGIENNVIFLGNRNDVNVLMNVFDIFLFPSHFEGLPVVGVEVQAAGKRCFMSDQIDKTVDLEIGLASFHPIYSGTEVWIEEIEEYLSQPVYLPERKKIIEAIIEKGYDNKKSVILLSNIYRTLSMEK